MSEHREKLPEERLEEVNLVIKRLGGPSAAAKLLRCRHTSVILWRFKDIPETRLMYLQAVRPDALEGTRYEAEKETV